MTLEYQTKCQMGSRHIGPLCATHEYTFDLEKSVYPQISRNDIE